MIRLQIPGFYDSDKGGPRWGDAQIIDDGVNFEVIDGYCGVGTTRLISRLKKRKIRTPYLHISHAHWDHYHGIRQIINDPYFKPKALYCYKPSSLNYRVSHNSGGASHVRSEIKNLETIIKEAKSKGIKVIYVNHGDKIKHGDIEFYVYRKQPTTILGDDDYGDAYINDGSLCYWFKNISYWTSGDGCEKIYDMCKAVGANPKFFKIPHHGNNCPLLQANGMKDNGAIYCWDNDYSTNITDFLKYGRRRCIEAGIKYLDCHGDLNAIFFGGQAVIYKDYKKYTYKCAYKGKTRLRGTYYVVVRKAMRGDYGNNDDRITNLLDIGRYPLAIQNRVNRVVQLAKDIKSGKVNYGKGAERIARINKELGNGYGQLVQDYIDVLYGIKESV